MCYVDNLCSQRRLEGSIFTIGTNVMWIKYPLDIFCEKLENEHY